MATVHETKIEDGRCLLGAIAQTLFLLTGEMTYDSGIGERKDAFRSHVVCWPLAHIRPLRPSSSMNQAAAAAGGNLVESHVGIGEQEQERPPFHSERASEQVDGTVTDPRCCAATFSRLPDRPRAGEMALAKLFPCSHAQAWVNLAFFYQAVACVKAVGVGRPLKILDTPQSPGGNGTVDGSWLGWSRLARGGGGCGHGGERACVSVSCHSLTVGFKLPARYGWRG